MHVISLGEFGSLTWDENTRRWHCRVGLSNARELSIRITRDTNAPLAAAWIEILLQSLRWFQSHEPAIRTLIADQMFDGWIQGWRDEEIDTVTSKAEFAESITLAGINVYDDPTLELVYDDGGLFGGHGIVLNLGNEGEILIAPTLIG